MAIIRVKEMRELDEKELNKRLAELKLEASKARAQAALGGAPPNPGRIGEIRRTIARALTIQKEKAVAKAKPAPKEKKPKGGK